MQHDDRRTFSGFLDVDLGTVVGDEVRHRISAGKNVKV
jgi:hypothetical protein